MRNPVADARFLLLPTLSGAAGSALSSGTGAWIAFAL